MTMKGQESARDTGACIAEEGGEGILWELKLIGEIRFQIMGYEGGIATVL